jgi:predicted RecA/RadA family phage recombinase
MAKNRVYEHGDQIPLPVPSGTVSGDPTAVGQIPCVALTDRDANGNASVQCDGVFSVPVKGIDGSGNAAVAVGDVLYWVSGDTPKLSKKTSGVRWGYAMATVGSGATATIAAKVGY